MKWNKSVFFHIVQKHINVHALIHYERVIGLHLFQTLYIHSFGFIYDIDEHLFKQS